LIYLLIYLAIYRIAPKYILVQSYGINHLVMWENWEENTHTLFKNPSVLHLIVF